MEILRKLYNWAIDQGLVEFNPCHGLKKPSIERSRERVLNDDEVRAIWKALSGEPEAIATMFRLRFLTAQRGGEVSHMRWGDLDLDSGWWVIPAELFKGKRSHRVPLSHQAVAALKQLQVHPDSPWVSPSRQHEKPLVAWRAVDRLRHRAGISFRGHDIRRTVATKLAAELGVGRYIIAQILGHAEPGPRVTQVYVRVEHDAEKKAALVAWAVRLQEIVTGVKQATNVVTFATPK